MNKGGTMKIFFIPTQGVIFACGEKDFFSGLESISFQGNPHKKRHRFALCGAKCVFLIFIQLFCFFSNV